MKKRIIILGIILIMTISLGVAREVAAASKKYLSLGTGNPAGTFYFIGAGFANLINKNVPEVRVIAESTAASEENFHLIIRNKMDLGLVAIHVIDPALEKKMDFSGLRLIALGHTSDRHWIVRKESPIKSISDFKGKRVAVGPPGSGTLVSSKMELDATVGITLEEIRPAYLSFSESITALRDGTVDVGCISSHSLDPLQRKGDGCPDGQASFLRAGDHSGRDISGARYGYSDPRHRHGNLLPEGVE